MSTIVSPESPTPAEAVPEADHGALRRIAERYRAQIRPDAEGGFSLSEAIVVPSLREAIVEGALAAGARLSEVHLARELTVSRTPVREAFAQLEREGLVTVVPRVGAFVRAVGERDVEEIYTVRAALESLAVQLVARALTAVGAAQFDEVLAAMAQRVAADDPIGYVRELDRFYALVMTLADNATLQRTHASLLGPVRRLRRIAMTRGGRMQASYDQTVRIHAAIVGGDAACGDLMREQLAHACVAAREVLRSG